MAIERNIVRLELELTRVGDSGYPLVNLFTGSTPTFPRSRDSEIQLVLLKDDALDLDVANISNITAEVKTYQSPTSAPLISVTILAAAINANLTDAQRESRSDQHALIGLPSSQTGLDMAGANADGYKTFSLVITATRNGKSVTLGWGSVQWLNDGGIYSGNTPTAGDPGYYNKEEVNGLLASALKIENDPGVITIFKSPDGQWLRLWGVDNDGNRIDDVRHV